MKPKRKNSGHEQYHDETYKHFACKEFRRSKGVEKKAKRYDKCLINNVCLNE